MFVYRHLETKEYVKIVASFLRKIPTLRGNSWEFLGLKMWNFQGIIFIWIKTSWDF